MYMIAVIILLVVGILMSAIFIASKVINYSIKTIILKGIASLFFLAIAIVSFCLTSSGHFYFKLFTVLGLFFGLLGDIFLGFKYVTTKTKKMWILLGMFAFSFGHIFYIVALLLGFYFAGQPLYIALPFTLPIAIITIYMLVAKKAGVHFGKGMFYFALYYLYCLTCMFSSSLSMAVLYKFNSTSLILFFVGAICFAASDFMLTGAYFKDGHRSKAYMAVYSIFYYAAQFLIALSIFYLV